MTAEEQLKLWVAGKPACPDENGQCCPDFSCCKPELLAPEPERRRFAEASDEERFGMLGRFLGAAIDTMDADVHIAGGGDA